MIDTLVGPVQAKMDALHREIAGLPLDDYNAFDPDNNDSILDEEGGPEQPPQEAALALGLGAKKRYNARQRAVRAAYITYTHRGVVHYTQGGLRWQAIRLRAHAKQGDYPRWADCSAFVTWCYWDATHIYNLSDFVNGASWRAGYTGTMTRHGIVVTTNRLISGDAIFYGGTWTRPHHVAIYVGNQRVISHGSESGPLLLKYDYREINHCRRFIR